MQTSNRQAGESDEDENALRRGWFIHNRGAITHIHVKELLTEGKVTVQQPK